jgi:CubicO group peptidase (beta-lactamase class C family)
MTLGYGYADVANKIPMKPETIGSICSISKLYTSVGVMQLLEKGKLRLDDLLTTFFIVDFYRLRVKEF